MKSILIAMEIDNILIKIMPIKYIGFLIKAKININIYNIYMYIYLYVYIYIYSYANNNVN